MAINKEALPVEVEAELARLKGIEEAATQLFVAVWRALHDGKIPDRTPIDDAASRLRGALTPDGILDSEWLPEPLATECAQGSF